MNEKFEFLLNIKKSIEICEALDISNYEFNKLKEKINLNYNLNNYETSLVENLYSIYSIELSEFEKFKNKSLNNRITDLAKILVKYYKKVDVARSIGISDTHLNRILNGLDKVKYTYEIYKHLIDLYNHTIILPYDILSDESYNYVCSENKNKDECELININEESLNKILNEDINIETMKEQIILMIQLLRNSGLKYTEIAKLLTVSNSLVHVTLRGKFPKNESKILNLYLKLKKSTDEKNLVLI